MGWVTRNRKVPLPPEPGGPVVWAEKLPRPAWLTRELDGPAAEQWFPWAPLLASDWADVIGKDGTVRYVVLLPDVVTEEQGRKVRAQAVLWGPADSRLPAEGGKLFRTPAPARKFYEALTTGRQRGDDPRDWNGMTC